MHLFQQKLIELIKKDPDVLKLSLNELAKKLSESLKRGVYAQSIKHHLAQLTRKGLIQINPENGEANIVELHNTITNNKLFNIPIVGAANCGDATILAVEKLEGYLKISPKILDKATSKGLIAIRAVGNSLNKAEDLKKIGGPIDEGDYVIVDCNNKFPKDGQYILSIIDSAANLKRFYKENGLIKLISESTSDYPPILIHEDDFKDYMVNGVVMRVIKN